MAVAELLSLVTPDLRGLLRILLLSVVLSLLAVYGFRRNAPAKRAFLLLGTLLLLAAPLVFYALPLVLPVGVTEAQPFTLSVPLPWLLLVLWLLPALFFVTRTLIANARARRRFASLPDLDNAHVQQLADDIAQALGCRHRPRLKLGTASCCLTLPQPVIVLPQRLVDACGAVASDADARATLRAVLTHELVHARRRDDRWLLLVQLLLDWYWWMPWLKVLAQRFEQAVEDSCDDRAADFFSPSHSYLSGVVAASTGAAHPGTDKAARKSAAYMSAHPLVGRVLRFGTLRDYDPDWPTVAGTAAVVLFGLMLCTAVEPVVVVPAPAYAMNQTARFVSPAPVRQRANQAYGHQVSSAHAYVSRPQLLSALRAHRLCEERMPIYPGRALLAGLEADVEVQYAIGQDGRVVGARIIGAGSRLSAFDRAVLRAVNHSRYPALHQVRLAVPQQLSDPHETGPPVHVRQRFRFALNRAI